MKTISIVTPCFNEELNVRDCYDVVRKLFETQLKDYNCEHIFCDNASTDSTVEILREIASADKSVRIIVNARNFGPMRNTYNGVMASSGDAVLLFLPADMQDPPDLLPDFVKLWEQGYEIVYGIRASRDESWIMRAIRGIYYRTLMSFSDLKLPPGVGDFQLVDRRVVEQMRQIRDVYPFMRMMTFEVGGRSVGVPYKWLARKKGISKNRALALIDQGINGFTSFTTAPVRLGLAAGFFISFLSIAYAFINLLLGFVMHGSIASPGIMTLIVALFFFGGVQLFFVGLVGEYTLAIYGQVRERPVLFERERFNFGTASTSPTTATPPHEGHRGAPLEDEETPTSLDRA